MNAAEVGALTLPVLGAGVWILARWRDLTALVIGSTGVVLAFDATSPVVAASAAIGAIGVAGAWARGAGGGVGRPGVNGAVLAAVAVALSAPSALSAWVAPDLPAHVFVPFCAGFCAMAGASGALVALERPGPRTDRPLPARRRVPIEEPPNVQP